MQVTNSYAKLSMDSGVNYVSVSGSSFAAGLDFVHPSLPFNGAASSLSFSPQLTTMGPVRPGFVRVTVDGGGGGNGAYTGGSVAFFGAPGIVDPIANDSCSASPSYPCTVPEAHHAHNLLGFQLGVPYTFAFSETASAYTESDGEGTYADYFMDYSYQLLEADGLTPVTVMSAAPEPGTLGLLGSQLALLHCFGKAIKSRSSLRVLQLSRPCSDPPLFEVTSRSASSQFPFSLSNSPNALPVITASNIK